MLQGRLRYKILLVRSLFISIFLYLSVVSGYAQQYSAKMFGKVSVKDLSTNSYSIDSSAGAIVIADIGSTEIAGNEKGGFSLKFHRYFRIHILKNDGYDVANMAIRLYVTKEAKEEIKDIIGVTYNLENGNVSETKLDTRKSVFSEKVDKDYVMVKFTMPAVKAGSIIECKYTLNSDFIFNMQPWTFQGKYPHLWSEYNLELPQFYTYVTLTQGNQQYFIRSEKEGIKNFVVTQHKEGMYGNLGSPDRYNISSSVTNYKWVMKDVPSLKEESFTSSVHNYFSGIEFQLSETKSPLVQKTIMSTWPEAAKELMQHEKFGAELSQDNFWIEEIVNKAIFNSDNSIVKARKIFEYVRDHFICTQRSGLFLTQTLRNLLKGKNGNVADINLLLVKMFRLAGLTAYPVILSLRSNGFTNNVYPLIDRYNYVICQVVLDDQTYYLDASVVRNGFNRLPGDCYNGHARVINQEAPAVFFLTDSLKETSSTTIFVLNDGKGEISGRVVQRPGYFESVEIRNKILKVGMESFISGLKKDFDSGIKITGSKIDSLYLYENPVLYSFDFESDKYGEDILYFNPMFGQGYMQNPFKSAKRLYPIEMPYTINKTYQLQLEVPHGYIVDELPKSLIVKLNEQDDGIFEYRISQSGDNISLRSRVCFKRAYFLPDEYETLREFFNLIVKKQAEQIVFKKQK